LASVHDDAAVVRSVSGHKRDTDDHQPVEGSSSLEHRAEFVFRAVLQGLLEVQLIQRVRRHRTFGERDEANTLLVGLFDHADDLLGVALGSRDLRRRYSRGNTEEAEGTFLGTAITEESRGRLDFTTL